MLRSLGCCERCVLAHSGVKDMRHYVTQCDTQAALRLLAQGKLEGLIGGSRDDISKENTSQKHYKNVSCGYGSIDSSEGNADDNKNNSSGKLLDSVMAEKEVESDSSTKNLEAGSENKDKAMETDEQNTIARDDSNLNNLAKDNGNSGNNEPICVSCLGLLQETGISKNIQNIICAVAVSRGYDCATWRLFASVPACLSYRTQLVAARRSVHTSMGSVFGERRDGASSLIKDVWKHCVSLGCSQALGMQVEAKAPELSISVAATYAGDEQECADALKCLETDLTRPCQRKKKHRPYKYRTNNKDEHQVEGTETGDMQENRGPKYSRQAIEDALNRLSDQQVLDTLAWPSVPGEGVGIQHLSTERASVFVAGRYNKLSRALSQTPWMIGGVLKCPSSVEQQLASGVLPPMGASDLKFLSSGREDVDVRCLGRGRPFALEVLDPRTALLAPTQVEAMARSINTSREVQVRDLQIVTRAATDALRYNPEDKIKNYRALCVLREGEVSQQMMDKLGAVAPFTAQQQTPLRVLHRRPFLIRPKEVYQLSAQAIDAKLFTIDMRTEAGAYIKELVHGDFGRTVPSITSILGLDTDILALDVTEIELDWPPALDSKTA